MARKHNTYILHTCIHNKLDVKNPVRGQKVEKTPFERKERNEWYILGKRNIYKKRKQRTQAIVRLLRVAVGAHARIYICMVTHIARVWIKHVRLPILLVVS